MARSVLPSSSPLAHLDVAAADRASGAVSTAAGADEVEAVRFRASTFAVVLHAHADARVLAVVGAASLELQRVCGGGHRAALVADAAAEGQLVDMDVGADGTVAELELAFEAAVCPLRVEVEVDLATAAVGEKAAAGRLFTHTQVVLRVRQFQDEQATLVPAGVDEAVCCIVSGIGPGKVRARDGSSGMALLDVVSDLFRILRIPEVHDANALIGSGIEHQPHLVAIVETDIVHHAPGGICSEVSFTVLRLVHIGLERGNDSQVVLVGDINET